MNRKLNWLLAALTLALIVLAQWLHNRSDDTIQAPQVLNDQTIDYALTDFTAEFFNAEGELDLFVEAPRLEHRADTRQALINQPSFTLPNQQPVWQGSAQQGQIERDSEQLQLIGNFVARQAHPNGEIQVESDRIRYDRSDQILHSPGPARISQTGTDLRGDTLTVWLHEQRAELNHDVQGTFDRIAAVDRRDTGG